MSTKVFPSTGEKPKFDPNAAYEVVSESPAPKESKPKFNPNKHFEAVAETPSVPQPPAQPAFQVNISQPTFKSAPLKTPTREFTDQQPYDELAVTKFGNKVKDLHTKIHTELLGNDALYDKKIRESRRDNYSLDNLRQDYKKNGWILPPQDEQKALQKEKQKRYDMPVTPEDISDAKTGTIIDERGARKFVNDLNKNETSADLRLLDKYNEVVNDPNGNSRVQKIMDVDKKIRKGEVGYDAETKTTFQPLGLVGSIMEGVKNKFKADEEHSFLKNTVNDAAIIKELEDERNNPDTDEPIKVPKGRVNEFLKSAAEMPLTPIIAGAAGTIGGSFIGNPELGTVAASALGAYENRKAQFTQTFKQVYNELRNQGKPEFDALTEARKQAENAQEIGTVIGAAQGLVGAKIGAIPVKGTNFSLGFQKAIGDFLKKNGNEFGKIALDAAAQGGLAASGELAKNKLAQVAGIKRDIDAGTADAFWGNAFMAGGIGAALKLGKGLSNIKYKTILSGITKNVPPEAITNTLQEKVNAGEITQNAADAALKEISDYKEKDSQIPPNVTEEARFKIQDNIDKINELEKQKEATHKSLQGPIQDKIDKLTEDNLALSKETEKPIKPVSGLSKDQEKEATELAEEWLHEGIIPEAYENAIKKDPIGFWKFLSQQAHNTDENWKPNEGPSPEQGMREDLGDTVVDYAKELFPAPEAKELPKSVSVIQPGEIKRPEAVTIGAGKVPPENIGHVEVTEHGEDTKTEAGQENGIEPSKLSEAGRKEAEELGQHLIDTGKKKVITSEVERAQETAKIAAEKANIPVETNPVLNTWNIGKYDGKPEGSFVEEAWTNKPNEAPEGGESFNDFTKRMEQAYQFVKSLPEDNHVVSHSKVMRALEALKKTDGKWTEETTKDFLTNKELSNAIQEPSPSGVLQHPQEGTGSEGSERGGVEPSQQGEIAAGTRPEEINKGKGEEKVVPSGGDGNLIGISHDALNELAQRLGLPKIERGQVRTPEEYAQMGRELLKQGVDPNTVLNSHLEPHEKASVARAYLEEMVKNADGIEDKSSTQYKDALQEIANFKANVIKKLGTQFAELGRALQGKRDLETDSFTAVSSKITDDTGKPLTTEQTQKVKELTEKNQALQAKVNDLEAKLTQATDEDLGKETKATSREPKTKKTHDQYVKERKDAFTAAREALKKLRGGNAGLGISIVPGARELAAIAPHIGTIVKSFVAEGVHKLGDVVDAIHDELSKDIIGLRRRDVIDLIAGKYETKDAAKPNELTEIKKQSRLIAKLEDLQNGLPEDFDKNKTEQSPEVKKLIEQIKKVKKDLADIGYMVSKKDEPLSPEEKNIRRLEKELEALETKQNIKQRNPARELTDKEKELKDKISEAKKNLGLLRSKELPITSEQLKINRLNKELADLQNDIVKSKSKKVEDTDEIKKIKKEIRAEKERLGLINKKEELSPEEKNINSLEKELEDLRQGIAKQKSPSRELTEKEKDLKEQIKDEREKLGLVSSKEKKPLTEQETQEQQEAKVKSIQEQFIDKKGNKFTHDEAKSIWQYMKETYLDKGVKFRDAIEQVSNDTGLSFEQISNAITTPKTKRISDAMWKQRYDLQKNRLATQRYVDAQTENPFIRTFKKITGARRSESIFGHAGVFIGTHAGMTLFDLPRTKYTIKAFLNAYKFGYGKIANYEKSMEGLKKRANYELAQRSGLKNNPDIIDNDAEITKPFLSKYLGKFMESGKRGYNAMKILRQDLFDAHYNALSDVEKADPGSAISIAREINNATGATNLDMAIRNKQGDIVFDPNEVFFAPGMEAARWAKLTRNPAKATSVALQALFKPESVSIKDKVFAKVWAKRVGSQLATFAGLLTANAAIQSMTTDDKSKKVNLTDPTKSDWLKFKFGNTTFDNTSGMLSTLHFIEQMAYQSAFDESSKYHETEEKSIGRTALKYGVGKLAPFYGDVAEGILRHDYNGNTMPWSDAKPLHNYNHKLSWMEYAESKLPLPVAEGFKAFYESAHANGMSNNQIDHILNGLQYGAISGLTGFKAYETKNTESSGASSSETTSRPSRPERPTRPERTNPHKR